MLYLNLDPDYFSHPKTTKLIALLGLGAECLPLKIWSYCAKYSPEKGLITSNPKELAIICGWNGDASSMLAALLDSCCIDATSDPTVFKVHDWEEHQGHIWALKLRGKANALKRWNNNINIKAEKHTSSIASSNAISNAPYLTLPNLTNKDIINKKFEKPTIEEIRAYCKEKGFDINAPMFWNYYETRGWMIGKNKIKSWKACIKTWALRQKQEQPEKMRML